MVAGSLRELDGNARFVLVTFYAAAPGLEIQFLGVGESGLLGSDA